MLSDDGTGQAKLYYYKDKEDATVAKVPIDINLLSAVNAVNGPLELELKVGRRTLRLKAMETADRDRWMIALTTYLHTHVEQHEAAVAMLLWGEPPRLELTSLGPRQLELQQQVAVQPLH